jgi:hypothetical protein
MGGLHQAGSALTTAGAIVVAAGFLVSVLIWDRWEVDLVMTFAFAAELAGGILSRDWVFIMLGGAFTVWSAWMWWDGNMASNRGLSPLGTELVLFLRRHRPRRGRR